MLRVSIVALALVFAPLVRAQSPRSSDEAGQLDFWVGTWDLTWPGGQGGTPKGEVGRGTNMVTRELGGCVVYERFASETGFEGESVSVYNPRSGQWRQTWVDNQGGYLLFTGGLHDGTIDLRTAPFTNAEGQEQVSRMTWRNVTADALDWHWQRSADGGATWTDVWVIRYTRR